MSLEVNVLGILIASAVGLAAKVGAAAAAADTDTDGAGAGSGVFQALPPQGSMLADDENMLEAFDVDVVGAAFCEGCIVVVLLDERLKTDDMLEGVIVAGC